MISVFSFLEQQVSIKYIKIQVEIYFCHHLIRVPNRILRRIFERSMWWEEGVSHEDFEI
jgi:hypothetical protein